MPRILLVDDEPIVTRSLQTLILDELPDIEVYSVNSSAEAMELLDKNMYDVVVTDVSMPRVSGLELLDRIKKLWPMCYVIVLTAYNSFDYAYKASQYEDVRFILKVEPPDVIMAAVRSGLNKVQQYFSASEDNQRIRQYMKEALPLLKQTLLERLMFFGEDLPERTICESCGISLVPGEDTWLAVTGAVESQETQQEIGYLVLSWLRGRGVRAEALYAGSNIVFLAQADGQSYFPSTVSGQLDRIIEAAGLEVGLSFVLSSKPVPWRSLRKAGVEFQRYAQQNLERSRIVIRDPEGEQTRYITLNDAFCWRRYIEQRSLPALTDALRECLLTEGFPQGRLACALLLQIQLREFFGVSCLEQVRTDRYTAEAVLFHGHFDTADEWLGEVRALLEALFSGSSIQKSTETEDMLDNVNRYIHEHFAEPISLTQIAEAFSYNSSYLSRVYKQKMHEGLNRHIIRTRIEAACQLLKESGMTVNEIAEQCGFQTTKYFITVFKRSKGMTPKAWRDAFSMP